MINSALVVCDICYSLLLKKHLTNHLLWHDALRVAVDETGIVGDFRLPLQEECDRCTQLNDYDADELNADAQGKK